MAIDLNTVNPIAFTDWKEILTASNGSFYLNNRPDGNGQIEGVITFCYNKKPNEELIRTEEGNLEELNRELNNLLKLGADNLELRAQRNKIRHKEDFLKMIRSDRAWSDYECYGINDIETLNSRRQLALSCKKNNVWSIAYKTGARFDFWNGEPWNYNEDINFEEDGYLLTKRERRYTWKEKQEPNERKDN